MCAIQPGDVVVGAVQRSISQGPDLWQIIPKRFKGYSCICVDEPALVLDVSQTVPRSVYDSVKDIFEIMTPDGVVGWIQADWVRALKQ
jgi:hypothetical protein